MSEKDEKKPVKKPASKSRVKKVVPEEVVEVETPQETNSANQETPVAVKDTDTKTLWIIIAVLGGLLTFIALFTGVKFVGEMFMKSLNYGVTQQHNPSLEEAYNEGYNQGLNDGYNLGYNDGIYGSQQSSVDLCSYEFMLQYGYQEGCVYIPENETIVPNGGMDMYPQMPDRNGSVQQQPLLVP